MSDNLASLITTPKGYDNWLTQLISRISGYKLFGSLPVKCVPACPALNRSNARWQATAPSWRMNHSD